MSIPAILKKYSILVVVIINNINNNNNNNKKPKAKIIGEQKDIKIFS